MLVDFAGTSDPFCELYVGKERKFITEIKKKTVTPVWNEKVTIELPKHDETVEIVSYVCSHKLTEISYAKKSLIVCWFVVVVND